MCGVAGFFPCAQTDKNLSILKSMSDALYHRGPDDHGIWTDGFVGFAHRRLSIFDLNSGPQPMHSSSGRYTISYNGEVYNFKSIRAQLITKGISFKTNTDTEVVIESIEFWGLNKALSLFHGMFAFALWDSNKFMLTLVRDRMGEKPLYYGWHNKTLLFASELKSMRCHPDWINNINHNALSKLMQYNYIPAPLSIYEGINKLEPGTLITFDLNQNRFKSKKEKWFNFSFQAETTPSQIYAGSYNDAVKDLDNIMNKVIKDQSEADVPVGVFLSGGLDSSLISSIMQSQSALPINTFTMGYENSDYDESFQAKKYSNYLGTSHTEMIVTANDALEIVPSISSIFDEPFADASQIPTILVSKMAKSKVKVVLSGDGADEMFGGYNRYFFGDTIYRYIKFAPRGIRKIVSYMLKTVPPVRWDYYYLMINKIFFQKSAINHPGEKIHKISSLLLAKNEYDFYSILVSMWYENNPVIDSNGHKKQSNHHFWANNLSLAQNMMNLDTISYLPDDILVKVDRSSMSQGLESRAPFLDYDAVNFAMRLPQKYKIKDNKGKIILRSILSKYIPEELHSSSKQGFSAPIHEWIRGPLREWSENLLSEEVLKSQGFFDVDLIRDKWKDHLSNKSNNQYLLWSVLMFQSWMENEYKNK